MDRSSPLFVVSAPRSGSTLLRLILDTHPNIAVPPPGWLFDLVYPYLYSYGDLSSDANFLALAEDILATPTVQKWPLSVTAAELVAAAGEKSFAGLYAALHMAYAKPGNKRRWGEKTPRNAFWIDEIHALFPDARFIHIVRDGRDMAIDISDSILLPYSVYSGANLWQRYVLAIRDSMSRLPGSCFIEIRYEDLCADPEATIRNLCGFMGEDFDRAMLAPNRTRSAEQWSSHPLHAKTSEPISTKYCEMYRTRLPRPDVEALEALIGDTLKLFGYPVSGKRTPIPERLAAQFIESDTVTNPENVAYRRWHETRRKERRDRHIWDSADRSSLLWGMN
ncbi:MAG: sulfotransferase [Burkholderiales bacterium]